MIVITRREFAVALGGAAAWPIAARGQQLGTRVIGLLNGQVTSTSTSLLLALRQGLVQAGFVEGQNLAIVYRSAEAKVEQLPALATELVSLRVAVIAAVGGDNAVLAAKAATATIPIVFTTGGDPVSTGFVSSIRRPGGNITGTTFMGSLVATKQIGLLRDIEPKLEMVGLLLNSGNPMTPLVEEEVQSATSSIGLKVAVARANTPAEIDNAFAQFIEQQIGALVIGSAVFFNRNLDRLVNLSAKHRIPAIFNNRDFAAAGGLMSYGADTSDSYRQAGVYVGRILKGDNPGDLPVMQSTRFEFVINLKTARTLGLNIPPSIMAIANELIE